MRPACGCPWHHDDPPPDLSPWLDPDAADFSSAPPDWWFGGHHHAHEGHHRYRDLWASLEASAGEPEELAPAAQAVVVFPTAQVQPPVSRAYSTAQVVPAGQPVVVVPPPSDGLNQLLLLAIAITCAVLVVVAANMFLTSRQTMQSVERDARRAIDEATSSFVRESLHVLSRRR